MRNERSTRFIALAMIFVFLLSVTLINMLIGMLVGVMQTVSAVEKERLAAHWARKNLLELMGMADVRAEQS